MIPKYLSAKWAAIAPALGNRLRQRLAITLGLGRRFRLVALAIAAVGGLGVSGLVNRSQIHAQSQPRTAASSPSFDVISVGPNRSWEPDHITWLPDRFSARGATAKSLIAYAYHVEEFQVSGGPGWISSEKYDIDAGPSGSVLKDLQQLPPDQRGRQFGLMVQSLLADRFKLALHGEMAELPVYALVVAKNGPKLQEAKPEDAYHPRGRAPTSMMQRGAGQLTGRWVTMELLAQQLSKQLGRTVQDQTDLNGRYNFTLNWKPDQTQAPDLSVSKYVVPENGKGGAVRAPPPKSTGPSIFTAIQEQLGLKLDLQKAPVEVLVVDHIEKPPEN
jgi:uncharacterized protein (TIGR03435 family)